MKKLFIFFLLILSNTLWAYELISIKIDKVKFIILQNENVKQQDTQNIATFFSKSAVFDLKNDKDIRFKQMQVKSDKGVINAKTSIMRNNETVKIIELFNVDMFLKKSQTKLRAKNGLIDLKAQVIYFNNDIQIDDQKSSQFKCQKATYLQKLEKLELNQCEADYNL